MRRSLLSLAVALAVAGLPVTAGPAAAATPPTGHRCALGAAPDRTSESATVGTLSAGPLAVADGPVTPSVTVTCTVQTGGSRHTDWDAVSATSPTTSGAAVLAPTLVSFRVVGVAYVCTAVTTDTAGVTETQYWDATTASWTTDVATATCEPTAVANAAVGGGVSIAWTTAVAPTVTPVGVLAESSLWTCTTSFAPGAPVRVTCTPQPAASYTWRCSGLHVDAATLTAGAVARTRLDCDGDAVAEARTSAVSGPGGHDSVSTVTDVGVTAFVCTVDDGAGGAPRPDAHAFCGDPGAGSLR
jgi:hypothetical protein